MKFQITAALLMTSLFPLLSSAQSTPTNEPLIFAKTERADIFTNGHWDVNRWRISPKITHDTLSIKLYGKKERVAFRTDMDSISFDINPGETKSFYVKLGDTIPAHTVIVAKPYSWNKVSYRKASDNKGIQFFYKDNNGKYFDTLKRAYPIGQLLKKGSSDTEKVLTIMNWVHHRWKHNGGNSPKGSTGLAILDEAKAGGQFPCFAYAIVLVDQLTAQGYKARVLYLKTQDAETRKGSPGHVAAEVYLYDQKKWAFIDGQFNVMPTLKGKPLNAVEFQQALSQHYNNVVLASRDQVSKPNYTDFVYDYLYYFDTAIDSRAIASDKRSKLNGKSSIMLVPLGAPNLTRMNFFNSKVDYCVYTNSTDDFYAAPTKPIEKSK